MEMDVNNTQITFIKSLVFYVLLFAPFYILLANNWLCFSILSTQPSNMNRTQRSRAVSGQFQIVFIIFTRTCSFTVHCT